MTFKKNYWKKRNEARAKIKLQATSNKQPKPQATSIKHQAKKATIRKLQATSNKRPDF